MNELPVCRHFIACERIEQTADRAITLHKLTARVVPLPGEPYPLERKNQCFLAVLTSGTGRHAIQVDLRRGVGGFEELVWSSEPGIIEMGSDPLAVRTLPIRLDWILEVPGQYEFVLSCGGFEIASVYIDARA